MQAMKLSNIFKQR